MHGMCVCIMLAGVYGRVCSVVRGGFVIVLCIYIDIQFFKPATETDNRYVI